MYNEDVTKCNTPAVAEPLMLIAEQTDSKLGIIISIIGDIDYKLNQNKTAELAWIGKESTTQQRPLDEVLLNSRDTATKAIIRLERLSALIA